MFPSLLALPAYAPIGNFALQLIGTGAAIAIAFSLTFLFGPRESADAVAATPSTGGAPVPAVPGATSGAAQASTVTLTGVVDVLSPVAGRAVPLAEVQDKVFSSGAMGQGVGIVPSDGRIYSPITGTVQVAMKTGHAYGIKSAEGVEALVHIGIDTVKLGGRGFTAEVTRGQQVRAGDLIAVVDRDVVAEAGYDLTTVLVVTNTKELTAVVPVAGGTVAHGDPALTVQV
ncbi:PTS glucose transporter subunit IIA [Georgenia sp. M64]|uniref:PTS sugar transporter subunit IIA n=1 Tax=Georgenia sp. M64 TaxID=3120520 RepID=UPI0030E46043